MTGRGGDRRPWRHAATASCAAALALVASVLAAPASGSLSVPGRAPVERFAPGAQLSSLPVADPAAVGARTNGRIFAAAPGRGAYTCSGTALNTPSRSVVLTAGHCILDGGVRATELRFVPAYHHGARPFGTFRASSARVMEGWRLHENSNYDLGALIVRPNALGRLTDVVGARGWATGRSRLAAFAIFGYPAGALRGQELRTCAGVGLGRDPHAAPGPPPIPSRCDMAAGASGGGWLIEGRYLNGVTSYSYTGAPRRLYSPYFGAAVAAFLGSLP